MNVFESKCVCVMIAGACECICMLRMHVDGFYYQRYSSPPNVHTHKGVRKTHTHTNSRDCTFYGSHIQRHIDTQKTHSMRISDTDRTNRKHHNRMQTHSHTHTAAKVGHKTVLLIGHTRMLSFIWATWLCCTSLICLSLSHGRESSISLIGYGVTVRLAATHWHIAGCTLTSIS